MKKRYTVFVLSIVATVLPVFVFGKESGIKSIVDNGGLEEWFMHAFTYLDVSVGSRANAIVNLGKAFGGVTALIYFGYLGWQMHAGDKEWSMTPFIRPLFLCAVILNWVEFTNIVKAPFDKLANYPRETFNSIEESASRIRSEVGEKREEFRNYYNERVDRASATYKMLSAEERENIELKYIINGRGGSEEIANLGLNRYNGLLDISVGGWVSEAFAKVSIIILRVCVYLIFFIQKIWLYILVLLGPIAIALSMLPGFESGFTTWLSKFFSISLYTFIAYTIINLGQQLIIGGYEMEISRMQAILDNEVLKKNPLLIVNYDISKMMSNTMMPSIISYIVTGIGVLMTPTIADTIVSAGSAGFRGRISKIITSATRGTIKKLSK